MPGFNKTQLTFF